MATRSVRHFPSRAPKRKTIWIGAAEQGDVAVGSGSSVLIQTFVPDDSFMLAPTVVRTRGLIQIRPSSFAADLDFDGAYGLGIMSDESVAAGQASLPRPFDDDSWPGWLVHGYYMGHLEFQSGSGVRTFPLQYVIDSKAMRKIGPGETLCWMIESRVAAVDVNVHARLLFKLS